MANRSVTTGLQFLNAEKVSVEFEKSINLTITIYLENS